jgi:CHAT domain-containing protein/uncharacterized protein HemY
MLQVRAFGFLACFIFCTPLLAVAQSAEEPALRALLERFFAAYQKEDIEDLLALWSKKSPNISANEQLARRTFADNDNIRLNSLDILGTTADGDKASVRILIDISAVDAKTGRAVEFGKASRTVGFVREGGEWKIWSYVSDEEDLAAKLIGAKTDGERRALLEARGESVTGDLVRELNGRGRSLFVRGEFSTALDVLGLALDIAKKLGDMAGASASLRMIGNIHATRGAYAQAVECYRNSLALSEELGDRQGIAGALNNLGNVYDALGDSARALEYFQRSLSIADEIKHPQLQTLALNNLGNIYKSQGDALRALEYFQRSQKLAEDLKDQESLSRALFNIGTVHAAQGSYQQALEFYQRSLSIKEKLGVKTNVDGLLGNIGIAYFKQGDYGLALDYHQRALKLGEEMGDKEVIAGSLNNIGDLYGEQGKYEEALEYYQKGLSLADAIGNKPLVAQARRDLGELYLRLGDYRKAVEQADLAAALALQADLPAVFWSARAVAGSSHIALNQFDLARRSLSDAISTIERLREQVAGGENDRERFFESKVAPYYAMVELALSGKDEYQALTYGERAKGRVLADVLGAGRADVTKAMTAQERERERELNQQVVALNKQIHREREQQPFDPSRLTDLEAQLQKARLEYEAFQTDLYAAHAELKLQRGQAPSLTPEQISRLLPDAKTALLEFVVGDESSYLFVLTRGPRENLRGGVELKTYKLAVKSRDLATLVRDFHRRLAERDLEFREPARQLYDLLLKPAGAQLRGKSLLCIVPDGVLWELPFQALQPDESSYLIEQHALFYAPSFGVLYGIERRAGGEAVVPARAAHARAASPSSGAARPRTTVSSLRSEPALLAFGNPVVGQGMAGTVKAVNRDVEFRPLPESEREVTALKEIYKNSNSRVYLRSEAREELAKAEMGAYNVLHFATHGVLDDLNPMYSHLVLSQPGERDGEDGLLHAWEIMKLDLKAELVVLSACQTARGRLGAGEGVVGMAWALFVAGSPTTVVSQWNVESSSTTRLMVEFHRTLVTSAAPLRQRPSKAEALRKATLSLLRNDRYAHPFYWAGFVMVGDGFRPLSAIASAQRSEARRRRGH